MAGHTKGPWHWVIHDHSMATLGVGDLPGLGDPHVLSIGPCEACADRASPKEWKWGRCNVPSEADAALIAAAPELLAALEEVVAISDRKHDAWDRARAAIAKATAP